MGFRLRNAIQIVPGIRLNFSKTGIGDSAGKRALARTDLERIMAEDSTYHGLAEAPAEPATATKDPA